MATKQPKHADIPCHLRPETGQWWLDMATEYALDAAGMRLLTLAAEAWDRCQGAREALAEHGTTYDDRWGQPHARPEVAIERDSRIGFARLVRELNLADGEPEPPTPAVSSRQRYPGRPTPAAGGKPSAGDWRRQRDAVK